MKHFFLAAAAAAAAALAVAFAGCGAPGAPSRLFSKDGSYALGMNVASSMKTDKIYPDMKEFVKGMNDVLSDSETRFTMEEAYQVLNDAFDALGRGLEADFLAESGKKPGVAVTESGLQYEVISEGAGPRPAASDTVRVHYQGTLSDGSIFDSSYSRDPVEFPLDGVIPGWTEGLQLMSVGSKYRLVVPSDLGYGPQGVRGQIPPYAPLTFEVELLEIVQEEL